MGARGFIGVLHMPAMPGDPNHSGGGFTAVEHQVLADAAALAEGGAHGVILENFGSAPFRKGTLGQRIPPHQVALMAILARGIRTRWPGLSLGINCLRNDAASALGIAAAADADFIRVNVHTGAYITDQGLIEGEAESSLRYRHSLGAGKVAIMADVLVKHAAPLVPLNAAQATRDTLQRGMADGIIVTGEATGAPISEGLLAEVRAAAGEATAVVLGSGVTPDNAATLAPLADGAIVGTWIKHEGALRNPVDVVRVRAMAELLGELLRWPV
ncbi:MAG: BtpA/SgcQ family protein [Myxococcota bacterium]